MAGVYSPGSYLGAILAPLPRIRSSYQKCQNLLAERIVWMLRPPTPIPTPTEDPNNCWCAGSCLSAQRLRGWHESPQPSPGSAPSVFPSDVSGILSPISLPCRLPGRSRLSPSPQQPPSSDARCPGAASSTAPRRLPTPRSALDAAGPSTGVQRRGGCERARLSLIYGSAENRFAPAASASGAAAAAVAAATSRVSGGRRASASTAGPGGGGVPGGRVGDGSCLLGLVRS